MEVLSAIDHRHEATARFAQAACQQHLLAEQIRNPGLILKTVVVAAAVVPVFHTKQTARVVAGDRVGIFFGKVKRARDSPQQHVVGLLLERCDSLQFARLLQTPLEAIELFQQRTTIVKPAARQCQLEIARETVTTIED